MPLWKERDDTSAFVRPVDMGRTITLHRNGSISWNSVPLWKERRSMAGEMHTDEVGQPRMPEGDDETPFLSAPS